ncbi:hypothetical protein V2J09_013381 [Rumex salicifolius]
METIVKVINSNSFATFRYPVDIQGLFTQMTNLPLNLRPRHFDSAFNMEHFCRDTVMTIWHYHGGCQVGKVVDKDYRVMGVDRLRVVDGSTYHDTPGTNPQATCMMLGRYMGRRILDARRDKNRARSMVPANALALSIQNTCPSWHLQHHSSP